MALGNLILQIVLMLGVGAAFYLARRSKLRRHCLVMRSLVGIQVVSIIVTMTSPLFDLVRQPPPLRLLTAEAVVHHTLGLIVLLIFVYVNLVYHGVVRTGWGFKNLMRTAFVLWALSLLLGIHLYVRIHV